VSKESWRSVRAFPRPWRGRYGDELADLLDQLRRDDDLRAADLFDVVRTGLAMRRQARTRRSLYGALGSAVAAACALWGLTLGGVLGPSPTTPYPPPAGRIVTLTPAVEHPGRVTLCALTLSTGAVLSCHTPTSARAHPVNGRIAITFRSPSRPS